MKATLRQPNFLAARAMASGSAISVAASTCRDLDIDPVLAELAAQVAAGRAEREHGRAGIKMIQRLFFNRIDAKSGAAAVGRGNHPPLAVLADEAEPAVLLAQRAMPRAKIADQPRTSLDGCHHMINTPAIGQRFLMILSYSSCPPIHTQIRSGPSSTAKA